MTAEEELKKLQKPYMQMLKNNQIMLKALKKVSQSYDVYNCINTANNALEEVEGL